MYRNKNIIVSLIVLITTLLFACSTDKNEPVDGKLKNKVSENEEAKNQKLDRAIDVIETLEFEQFNIEFKKVKAYEKKDRLLLDIHFDWRNKGLGDGGTLFVATELNVAQDGAELKDIDDHWNPEGDRGLQNDVFMNTAAGSAQPVKLTYELVDKENEIKLTFTPTTETEDGQTFTIDIN